MINRAPGLLFFNRLSPVPAPGKLTFRARLSGPGPGKLTFRSQLSGPGPGKLTFRAQLSGPDAGKLTFRSRPRKIWSAPDHLSSRSRRISVLRLLHYKRPSLIFDEACNRRFGKPGVRFITRLPFLLFFQNSLIGKADLQFPVNRTQSCFVRLWFNASLHACRNGFLLPYRSPLPGRKAVNACGSGVCFYICVSIIRENYVTFIVQLKQIHNGKQS